MPLVFLVSFAAYVLAMAPGPYLRDSGELASAALGLGVAHETGFSLWCLLGRAATLLPVGELATRVTLLSAAGGALATALVYALARRLAARGATDADERVVTVAGVAAAALFALGYTVWKQATVVEVYAPTAAAIAGALVLADRAADGNRRAGLVLALLAGLATTGLHASFRLLVLPPLCVLAGWRLRRGDRWPLLAPLLFAVGAAVAFYIPVAAARDPVADWGDPRRLGQLVDHLAATRIRHAFAGQMLSHDVARVWHHLLAFLRILDGQLGLPAIALGLAGIVVAVARRRALGLLLACLLVGETIYAAWINPMGVEDLQTGVPAALAIAVGAGVAVAAIARRLLQSNKAVYVAAALAVIAVAPCALADAELRFAVGDEYARLLVAAYRDLPPRALVLVESDDLAAGALYAEAAWGLRPDVTVLVRQQLTDGRLVERTVRRSDAHVLDDAAVERWAALAPAERERDAAGFARFLVTDNLARRAVYWEPGDDPLPPSVSVTPGVPLWRLDGGSAPAVDVRALVAKLHDVFNGTRDPLARQVEASQLTSLAARAVATGRLDDARALYDVARAVHPGDAVADTGLAVVLAMRGDFASALTLAEGVAARDPERLVARMNAGRYALVLGQLDRAEAHFRIAAKWFPASPSPWDGLARVALARHDADGARRAVAHALQLDPDDADARSLAGQLAR